MEKNIIIENIRDNDGGGYTAYREGSRYLCGDGQTPIQALTMLLIEIEQPTCAEFNRCLAYILTGSGICNKCKNSTA